LKYSFASGTQLFPIYFPIRVEAAEASPIDTINIIVPIEVRMT
jgi:hypothetical protein